METLVTSILKFRSELFGKKQERFARPSELLGLVSFSTGDVWVYDFDSERFTSLLDDAFPRLKASR